MSAPTPPPSIEFDSGTMLTQVVAAVNENLSAFLLLGGALLAEKVVSGLIGLNGSRQKSNTKAMIAFYDGGKAAGLREHRARK